MQKNHLIKFTIHNKNSWKSKDRGKFPQLDNELLKNKHIFICLLSIWVYLALMFHVDTHQMCFPQTSRLKVAKGRCAQRGILHRPEAAWVTWVQ